MKKIIYSLVIMIAAGSLFTSCIEPVEPESLAELRHAKAEYLKALAQLESSKTALIAGQAAAEQALAAQRQAEATYQLAMASYQDALTAALNAKTEMERQQFALELQRLTKLYEDEALMRALEYDAAVAKLEALKKQYEAEAAEYAIQLALMQAEVDYKALLNEAQRIQNLKDQQDMELAKKAFEQEYGQQAAMFALQLARYEAETQQMAAEAAALVAAQELLNKNQELQNEALAQEIAQAKAAFEQKYGYDEAMNALELARVEAANNAAAAEAQAKLEDMIDQFGYEAAMRILDLARQAVKDEADAQKYELEIKAIEEAYNQQVALDAIEIAKAEIEVAKKTLDLEALAATVADLKRNFEYAEIYRANELQKALDNYGIDALKAANEMENLKMQQELNIVLFKTAIAEANQTLKETLDAIDLSNVGLTEAEKEKIAEVIEAYEIAYAAYLLQQVVVMEAEADLFDAQYAQTHPSGDYYVYLTEEDSKQHAGLYTLNFAPTAENYQAAIDLLNEFIEADKAAIAELEEKGSLPNNDDLVKWAAELQAWKDQIGKNEYYQYAQTQDSINYMINVYHDGMAAVAQAVLDWAQANPYIEAPDPVAEVMEPNLDLIDAMTIDDMEAEVLEFDTLPIAYGNAFAIDKFSDYSFNKLRHMLQTSGSQDNDIYPRFINRTEGEDGWELQIEDITRNGKDFILGYADFATTDKSIKYEFEGNTYEGRYGLEGVYTALAREKVMKEKDASFKEKAEANYNYAKERWENDYAFLQTAPDAYLEAKMKAYEEAAKAYTDAVKAAADADKAIMKNMAEKTKALLVTYANLAGDASNFTVYDSTSLFNALHEFAVAREALGYPAAGDSNYMKYADGFNADMSIREGTIKFSEITLFDVRDGKIGRQVSDGAAYGPNPLAQDPTQPNVFAYWASQMLSQWMAAALMQNPMPTRSDEMINGNATPDGDQYRAFYNTFKYVPDADPTKVGKVVKVSNGLEEPYKPTVVSDAAMKAAEKAVKDAYKEYAKIYNRFWAENVSDDITDLASWAAYKAKVEATPQKAADVKAAREALVEDILANFPLDVNCYTFNTFCDPFTAVIFQNSFEMAGIDQIFKAHDLNVILTAVDPWAEGRREGVVTNWHASKNFEHAQILYGSTTRQLKKSEGSTYEWDINPGYTTNATEFTQYLFAWQQYIASQVDMAKDLELLRAWITSIEETIAADVEAAETELEEFKENLKAEIMAGYEEALAKHDAAVEAYNAQMEARAEMLDAWAEFFGTYDNPLTGETDTLAYVWILDRHAQFWTVDRWRNEFACHNYHNVYVDQEAGVWNGPQPELYKNLIAGTFQEILDENIPGYPEKVAQWNKFHRQYVDVQYHLQTIYDVMNDAYMAAAKVVDPDATEDDLIEYVAAYKAKIQAAIAALYDEINEHTAMIEWFTYAKAQVEAGVDPYTQWAEICQLYLDFQNQVLADLKVQLDLAQKDYDDVMAYINAKAATAED